jgi:molybdenum cofactor cytidylyltransferase
MAGLSGFGAILLAAGLSKRMGGPNKLLQPYRGKPLAVHALETLSTLGLSDCLAVTGRDAEAMEALAAPYGFRCVYNSRYAEGMGTSIAAGAAAISGGLAGIFVCLGDMPAVLASDYAALAHSLKPGAVAVPVYQGMRGHPVLFCASLRGALSQLTGDQGARSILANRAVLRIESENPGVLLDFDQPEHFTV